MKLKPLSDRVIVESLEAEEKTASGIIIPDSAKEKPQIGQVMAVGPGKSCCCDEDEKSCGSCNMLVKAGDKVMYKKWGGNEVKVGGEEWTIVEQKDILAIVK